MLVMPAALLLRRGFHYYLWLYSSIGNGALASHI